MMGRTLLTVAAALICWLVVWYKFGPLVSQASRGHTDLRIRMWLVTLLIALSLTLHVDAIQIAVGQWSGLNNLGWYLAYLLGVTGFYLVGYLFAVNLVPYTQRLQQALVSLLLVVYLCLTLLYTLHIVDLSEWPARAPRTWQEASFMTLFFGYGSVAVGLAIPSALRFYRQDRYLLARTRIFIGLVMALLANLCFWLKVAYAWLIYLQPDSGLAEGVNQVALLSMGLTAPLLILFVSSHRWYHRLFILLASGDRLRGVVEMRVLQRRLFRLTPPVIWTDPSLWMLLGNLDYYQHRMLISILDSQKMLRSYLARVDAGRLERLEIATAEGPLVWDRAALTEARLLNELLHTPKHATHDELVEHFRRLGRQYWQRENAFTYFFWWLGSFLIPSGPKGQVEGVQAEVPSPSP